jgi:hypothetical protein
MRSATGRRPPSCSAAPGSATTSPPTRSPSTTAAS